MPIKTRLTELLRVDLPIVLGGMAWAGNARLAAAVSAAGGLGIIGAATMSETELRAAISEVRAHTDRPFGVNISLVVSDGDTSCRAVIEGKVPVATVSGGSPQRLTARLKQAGVTVIHVVPTARLAAKSEAAGVDAVVAEGVEAGGHLGREEIPLSVLVPLARAAVRIPVIAAGGIVCGRGLAAALVLGADGVQIGTLFAAAEESPAHPIYKQMVVDATETDPVVYGRLDTPARGLRTPAVQRLVELDRTGSGVEQIREARGLGRGGRGMLEGDLENGIFLAGLGAARIERIRPVREIMQDLEAEYYHAIAELPRG